MSGWRVKSIVNLSRLQGDVFSPDTWKDQLKGAVGVISTLGAFGSNDFMYRFVQQLSASFQQR